MPASRAQRTATAKRRGEAVAMKLAGHNYEAIAQALGYSDRGAACKDVTRAFEAAVAEQSRSVEAMREEELQRLDLLLIEAWGVLKRDHLTVSHGRIILDDEGKPILDDAPVLQAIERILKIQERRAKFLGLDAPVRHEVVTIDVIDAEIARLTEELGRVEAGEAPAPQEAPAGT